MSGDKLYPLFQLKNVNLNLYENEIKKYDDHPQRKTLPWKKINPLDCVRGDVLHCSSIHPHLVYQTFRSIFSSFEKSVLFYRIPISKIQKNTAELFDMNRPDYEFGKEDPDSVFDPIDPVTYKEIIVVPPEVKQFYQDWKNNGEKGAPIWGKVPHIFVKDVIDVSDCEVIDWKDSI